MYVGVTHSSGYLFVRVSIRRDLDLVHKRMDRLFGNSHRLGLGNAMLYPTLLAGVGDVANQFWRASAVGVYRLWRDSGYAIGALLAGSLADLFGVRWAIGAVGGLTFLSGLVVATLMYETRCKLN